MIGTTGVSGFEEPTRGSLHLSAELRWQDLVLEQVQLSPGQPLTLGERTGWRWRLLGADLGVVPAPLRYVLPLVAPGWSEVHQESLDTLSVPDAGTGADSHTLMRPAGRGWVARVSPEWPVATVAGDRRWELPELLASGAATRVGPWIELQVPTDRRLEIGFGGFSVVVTVGRPSAPTERGAPVPEPGLLSASAVSLALAVLLGAFSTLVPGASETAIAPSFERLLTQTRVHVPPPPLPATTPPSAGGTGTGRSDPAPADPAPGTPGDEVRTAGLMSAFDSLGDVFGSSALPSALAATDGWTVRKGQGPGGTGLGIRAGLAGGDGGYEGLGGGADRFRRAGDGEGDGWLCGAGPDQRPCKREGAIHTVGGDPVVLGAMDRSLIDEVIREHLQEIRYCYQKQLQVSPDLAGDVTMKFTIAADGTVSSAKPLRDTLSDPAVGECIAKRVLRFRFPAPKGGGIVVVSYPFRFAAG